MIQTVELGAAPATVANRILVILDNMESQIATLNRRLDDLEAGHRRTADVASCLANGIIPD